MSTLKRKGGDDTPVHRSGRLVYQKDYDVVDLMGDSSKTKSCARRSRKLVYQGDPGDDDFVDESSKLKIFGRMMIAEYKIMRMGCRTMKNFVDCGVFAMRHMKTYKGEGHYGHICGLRTEGKAQNFILNDLQCKYVAKMLLCEINMKKEVEIETEAYKSISIGEK
ncbi:hypothetical protein Tco_1396992 [Tanacetum coccineum]